MTDEIVLMELFSGIGGFHYGLKEASFKIKKCYFSEIDKHAIANYKYNFKDAEYIGSVRDVSGTEQRADIITFGSPCQDFSIAGKGLGMEGQRSVLILEAIRIIMEQRPSIFIWENVKGAFSSNDGADFWAIIAAFANIGGYRLEWQLLNTKWFLPQNRERIYLIGHLAEPGRDFKGVFPFTESDFKVNELQGQQAISTTIKARHTADGNGSYIIERKQLPQDVKSPQLKTKVAFVSRSDEAKQIRKESKKTKGKDYSPFQGKKIEFKDSDTMNTVTCAAQKDNLIMQPNELKIKDYTKENSQGNRIYDPSGISTTINSGGGDQGGKTGLYEVENTIRRLTEIEVERLQGFPDNWTEYGDYDGIIKKISKTQRYKMCGNAITTNVVKAIGERLRNQFIIP